MCSLSRTVEDISLLCVSTGVVGVDCLISHELCLSEPDLTYLLDTRREARASSDVGEDNVSPTGTSLHPVDPQHEQISLNPKKNSLQERDTGRYEWLQADNEQAQERNPLGNERTFNKHLSTEPKFMSKKIKRVGFIMIYPSPVGRLYDQVNTVFAVAIIFLFACVHVSEYVDIYLG